MMTRASAAVAAVLLGLLALESTAMFARLAGTDPRNGVFLAFWLAAALMTVVTRDRRGVWTDAVLRVLAIASVIPCLLACVQWTMAYPPGSTLLNPLYFGDYLAALVPLTIAIGWLPLALLQVIALGVTHAIGAWLALGLGLLCAAWRPAWLLVPALTVLMLAAPMPEAIAARLPSTLGVRIDIWRSAQQLMWRAPWFGAADETIALSGRASHDNEPGAVSERAHNWPLDLMLTHGAIGLASSTVLIAVMLRGPSVRFLLRWAFWSGWLAVFTGIPTIAWAVVCASSLAILASPIQGVLTYEVSAGDI